MQLRNGKRKLDAYQQTFDPDQDADLDAEPEELMCPITRTVFRDPVVVVDSGHTYERSAILSHFGRNGARDPLTSFVCWTMIVCDPWGRCGRWSS
jgi:hypothetical protein